MEKLNASLDIFSRELIECGMLPFIPGHYAIFGSTSLIMRGILDREPGDIDVHMTRALWGRMLARPGWFVETPKRGDPPILSNENSPIAIHAFFDWSDTNVEMDVPDLINRAELVEYDLVEYCVIPVVDALNHKKFALRYGTNAVQKHVPDIQEVEEWLERNQVSV